MIGAVETQRKMYSFFPLFLNLLSYLILSCKRTLGTHEQTFRPAEENSTRRLNWISSFRIFFLNGSKTLIKLLALFWLFSVTQLGLEQGFYVLLCLTFLCSRRSYTFRFVANVSRQTHCTLRSTKVPMCRVCHDYINIASGDSGLEPYLGDGCLPLSSL